VDGSAVNAEEQGQDQGQGDTDHLPLFLPLSLEPLLLRFA